MLTRLRVRGFKNLADVDVRFGPFTCVAGANGVGKSNLFDAIHFLSLLADHPLLEAAQAVRGGHSAGVRSLFHRVGDRYQREMSFTAQIPEDSLLVAVAQESQLADLGTFRQVAFHPLPGTWRAEAPDSLEPVPFGKLLAYLQPVPFRTWLTERPPTSSRRVVDREDVQNLLLPFGDSSS